MTVIFCSLFKILLCSFYQVWYGFGEDERRIFMNNILSLIYTYLALQSLSMYPWENSRPTHVVCYLLLPLYLIIIIVSDKETQATIKQE